MSIQDIGSIGELIAAIATLATLVYLATQIRQNTKSLNSNNSNTVMQGFNQFNTALFSDPSLATLWQKSFTDFDSLSEAERSQLIFMHATVINIYRNLYHQYLDGTFPEHLWLPWAAEAKQIMMSSGGQLVRQITRTYDDLWSYLDGLGNTLQTPMDYTPLAGAREPDR